MSQEAHWVKAMRHIRAYNPEEHHFSAPWELTQNGIAEVLGISRPHATLVLKSLQNRGLVEARLVHIIGGSRRRKVYLPTPAGMMAQRELSR